MNEYQNNVAELEIDSVCDTTDSTDQTVASSAVEAVAGSPNQIANPDSNENFNNRIVEIAVGKHKRDMKYVNADASIPDLLKFLTKHITTNQKNGANFLQGSLLYDANDTTAGKKDIRGRTKHINIQQMELIAFDIDNGMMLDDAINAVKKSGYLAVVYTSFKHTKAAPRFRVVFVLSEPFIIKNHLVEGAQWKLQYAAVADNFKFPYDDSCKNIGRKFYNHASSRANKKMAYAEIINEKDGKFIDLNDFNISDMSEFYGIETPDIMTNAGYDLTKWDIAYAKSFQMAKLLKDKNLDYKDRSDGGYEIECPHGDDHASGDPYGAFVTDANGDNGFNICCSHNTCIKKFGDRHQRLHHLKKLIDGGKVTVEDIENPEYGGGKPRTELPDGYFYARASIMKERGEEASFVCSGVEFITNARDYDSNWTLGCKVTAPDGVEKDIYLSKRIIGKDFALDELRNAGAKIAVSGKINMSNLLALIEPENEDRFVSKGGWHDDKFVLTGKDVQVYGSDEQVLYIPTGNVKPAFNIGGELSDWKREIASKAVGNSRLEFVLCAAFAAPLLTPLNIGGGGFHLHGGSSIGKTIAAKMFGSVYGGHDYIHTHRATDNALESVAEMHNDTGLVLDEISQADVKTVGETIYMLSNGEGKSRASANADARAVKTWRVLVLSTGEVTIDDKMQEDKFAPTMKAGQAVRMIDLVADAGAGMGIVENPYGLTSGEFVDALSDATAQYHGTAIREFLSHFVKHKEVAISEVTETMKRFSDAVVPEGADGQVGRIAERFGVCAAAGELAIKAGVLPWKQGDAVKACEQMFQEYIGVRGYGSFEVAQGVASVEKFLVQHGATRFQNHYEPEQQVHNRIGWYKDSTENDGVRILLIPVAMWPEVCSGYDPDGTAKALADKGILQPDKNGKLTQKFRPRGLKPIWCRVLIFQGEVDLPALETVKKPTVNLQGNLSLRKQVVYLAMDASLAKTRASTKSPEVLAH